MLPLGIEVVIEPSWRLILAALALAVFSTVFFALGPAWALSRPAVVADLKETPDGRGRRGRTGALLVVGQLALSLALVAAGGLFVRAAINAADADPGFSLEHQLIVSVDPSLAGYERRAVEERAPHGARPRPVDSRRGTRQRGVHRAVR